MYYMIYRPSHVEKGAGPHSNSGWKLRSVFSFPLLPVYTCRDSSTDRPPFSQNKPNLPDTEMSVTVCDTRVYENKSAFPVKKNKAKSKPISNAQSQFQTQKHFSGAKNRTLYDYGHWLEARATELIGGKKRTGNGSRAGLLCEALRRLAEQRRLCHNTTQVKQGREPRFMHYDEVKSYFFDHEASDPDVYDSKLHGYRYSRYACSGETCISCPQPKSLVFFPSLLLIDKSPNKKAVQVSCLRLRPEDFLIFA